MATFDHVVGACQWSQEEVSHLLPTLRAETHQILSNLNVKGDHRRIKTTSTSNNSSTAEIQRQRFRHFCYQEAEGPREVCSRLQELCHCWLEPESHTKEQILERLILKQFLTVLPKKIQSRVQEHDAETCAQAVALAEGFLLRQQKNLESEPQESDSFQKAAVNLSEGQQAVSGARQRLLAKEVKKHDNGKASLLGSRITNRGAGAIQNQEIKDKETHGTLREALKKKKPYNCIDCGKCFVRLSDLAKHDNISTGAKPFHCMECGIRFSQLSHLTRHQKIHTEEKPHICTECGASFAQRESLVSHPRVHSGEHPYHCSHRQQYFSHQSALKVH
ncbi:zinc finger protein with KRAB and SCAN domains 1-like [Ahaetulla prasina]|uniref:zinc finger protein with KRAB and SCAN domains 1-like n=1 Tax=Ahaetulla prasina TaxID=499056 RepID=UPI002648FA46|nr:zinc finger protein with KRAB and SCAN domains 1-like [Ahaetulla prasina]